jgi:hypothetical protein
LNFTSIRSDYWIGYTDNDLSPSQSLSSSFIFDRKILSWSRHIHYVGIILYCRWRGKGKASGLHIVLYEREREKTSYYLMLEYTPQKKMDRYPCFIVSFIINDWWQTSPFLTFSSDLVSIFSQTIHEWCMQNCREPSCDSLLFFVFCWRICPILICYLFIPFGWSFYSFLSLFDFSLTDSSTYITKHFLIEPF